VELVKLKQWQLMPLPEARLPSEAQAGLIKLALAMNRDAAIDDALHLRLQGHLLSAHTPGALRRLAARYGVLRLLHNAEAWEVVQVRGSAAEAALGPPGCWLSWRMGSATPACMQQFGVARSRHEWCSGQLAKTSPAWWAATLKRAWAASGATPAGLTHVRATCWVQDLMPTLTNATGLFAAAA
jgi:hypothetical protein